MNHLVIQLFTVPAKQSTIEKQQAQIDTLAKSMAEMKAEIKEIKKK